MTPGLFNRDIPRVQEPLTPQRRHGAEATTTSASFNTGITGSESETFEVKIRLDDDVALLVKCTTSTTVYDFFERGLRALFLFHKKTARASGIQLAPSEQPDKFLHLSAPLLNLDYVQQCLRTHTTPEFIVIIHPSSGQHTQKLSQSEPKDDSDDKPSKQPSHSTHSPLSRSFSETTSSSSSSSSFSSSSLASNPNTNNTNKVKTNAVPVDPQPDELADGNTMKSSTSFQFSSWNESRFKTASVSRKFKKLSSKHKIQSFPHQPNSSMSYSSSPLRQQHLTPLRSAMRWRSAQPHPLTQAENFSDILTLRTLTIKSVSPLQRSSSLNRTNESPPHEKTESFSTSNKSGNSVASHSGEYPGNNEEATMSETYFTPSTTPPTPSLRSLQHSRKMFLSLGMFVTFSTHPERFERFCFDFLCLIQYSI
jgi:hypothetical protein